MNDKKVSRQMYLSVSNWLIVKRQRSNKFAA